MKADRAKKEAAAAEGEEVKMEEDAALEDPVPEITPEQ